MLEAGPSLITSEILRTLVTRTFTRGAAQIHFNMQDELYLDYIHARRGWGFARRLLGHVGPASARRPDDYLIGTEIDPRYYRQAEQHGAASRRSRTGIGVDKSLERQKGVPAIEA